MTCDARARGATLSAQTRFGLHWGWHLLNGLLLYLLLRAAIGERAAAG